MHPKCNLAFLLETHGYVTFLRIKRGLCLPGSLRIQGFLWLVSKWAWLPYTETIMTSLQVLVFPEQRSALNARRETVYRKPLKTSNCFSECESKAFLPPVFCLLIETKKKWITLRILYLPLTLGRNLGWDQTHSFFCAFTSRRNILWMPLQVP